MHSTPRTSADGSTRSAVATVVAVEPATGPQGSGPEWLLRTPDGAYRTAPDAGVGVDLCDASFMRVPQTVRLHLDASGMVFDITSA